jgi:hypothetical protein
MASKTGRNGVIAMVKATLLLKRGGRRTGLLKRSQRDIRKQRQAWRIAPDRHLLLCRCFHLKSCIWCWLSCP